MKRALIFTLKHAQRTNLIKTQTSVEVNTNQGFTDATQQCLEGPSFLIQLWGEKTQGTVVKNHQPFQGKDIKSDKCSHSPVAALMDYVVWSYYILLEMDE